MAKIKKFADSLDIPNIKDVIKATAESKKKRQDELFATLLERTLPFHQSLLAEIDKAVTASIDTCCIKNVPQDVARELARQYENEKYVTAYRNETFFLIWSVN